MNKHQKDQIILAPVWGILADFSVPYEIESCNFQNLLVFGFPETSQNLILYWTTFNFIISKGEPFLQKMQKLQKSAKIAPNRGQDDLVLMLSKFPK